MDDKAKQDLNEAERLLDSDLPEIDYKKFHSRGGIDEYTVKMIDKIILLARPLIEDKVKKTGEYHGKIQCPSCGGVLCYSKCKSNGHIRGECETEGCLQWRE